MPVDFTQAPFIVIREVTLACALACLHCRADGHPPQESSGADTSEGVGLIEFEKGYELYTAHAETVDDVRYVFDWNSRPSFLRPGGPR